MLEKTRKILLEDTILLEIPSPIIIVGDIHGHLTDLQAIFQKHGLPPSKSYLFLGDYVDRGGNSIETISLLFSLKIKYPKNVYLLRGNHECKEISRIYGFYDECKRWYSISLWKVFNDCFDCLPLCAIVENQIFCVHSGLSPQLTWVEDIRRISRPVGVEDTGLICDLLWSRVDANVDG